MTPNWRRIGRKPSVTNISLTLPCFGNPQSMPAFVIGRFWKLACGHRILRAGAGVGEPPGVGSPVAIRLAHRRFLRGAPGVVAFGGSSTAGQAEAARGSGCRHLMVVSGYRDAAKKEFLRHCGLQSEVVWWVKPIRPDHNTGRIGEVRMVVGPAPPVYDPGGLTAMAIEEPREAGLFEDAAAEAGAVLAIMNRFEARTGS